MSKMVEFRYYFNNAAENYPSGDWLNNLSSSIFYNYTKPDQEIWNIDGTTIQDNGKFIIDKIRFSSFPGMTLILYMGKEKAVSASTIVIGYSGIYELNLKEMNKNIQIHNNKLKIFGFDVKSTDKEIMNLTQDKYIIVTITYSYAHNEKEEMED